MTYLPKSVCEMEDLKTLSLSISLIQVKCGFTFATTQLQLISYPSDQNQ